MTLFVQIAFGIVALVALFSAVMVVSVRNLIHAALWLIATFFTVAALFLLMEAEFISLAQVLIYVGAISILILFAIMLTRDVEGEITQILYRRWWVGGLVAAALFGLLIAPTVFNHTWKLAPPTADGQPTPVASTIEIGTAFLREYLLPFEVASVLLLVALIGAIVIAAEEGSARRRVLTLAEEVAMRRKPQEPEARTQEPEEETSLVTPINEANDDMLVNSGS